MAAGNGGQEISQYSWFTVYASFVRRLVRCGKILPGHRPHICSFSAGDAVTGSRRCTLKKMVSAFYIKGWITDVSNGRGILPR